MKRRTCRRYSPQRQRRVTRRGAIHKKASRATDAVIKPTYFSLLKDVEHALKVDHIEGISLIKLKRELEQKYGRKKFDVASNKMLKSAVKRLRNRGRIAKIHPNSSLFRFNPPMVPNNYNFFGPGPTHSKVPPPVRAKPTPRKQSMSMSESVTMSRSTTRGSGSRSTIQGQGSQSTTQGSISTISRSPSNSIVKPISRGLKVRNLASSAKKKRVPIWRR